MKPSRGDQGGESLWSGSAPISRQGEVRLAVPKQLLPPGSNQLSWAEKAGSKEVSSEESVEGMGAPAPPRQERYRFTAVATPPR
ncbi:MAG: hypothetical protein K0U98_13010 [Deltaproteobacteria bacterium]|nr:hypothetical protein [Deltaproteobacteria bacterium]